jgi:serine/threonine-protein kinase RsbW/stage II sporulation protein AB (anti-sigma F factor)
MSTLELRLAAEPPSVAVARHAIAGFAAANGADPGAVAVAVSEAVTNAVLHAFADPDAGRIAVEARLNGVRGLVVVVSDDGHGITPNPDSPGLGFGLALAASLADEVAIERPPAGGTRVRMRFATTA